MKTQFFNLNIFNGKGNCNHYNCKKITFHSISEKNEHIVNKNSEEFLPANDSMPWQKINAF